VDVRTLFATHVDLAAAVNQRLFRHDLYHRITQAREMPRPLLNFA
jgi:transcriptional regulator with GAF, ATPase, and Fis domain